MDCERAARHSIREKTIERWLRVWKVDLIEASNPGWEDLYGLLV